MCTGSAQLQSAVPIHTPNVYRNPDVQRCLVQQQKPDPPSFLAHEQVGIAHTPQSQLSVPLAKHLGLWLVCGVCGVWWRVVACGGVCGAWWRGVACGKGKTGSEAMLFSRLSCHFIEYVLVHQRVSDECLTNPQRRSQQCQRVPSVRVHSDRVIDHSETGLSRFSPDAQLRPAMPSRINTKGAGTSLFATQIATNSQA